MTLKVEPKIIHLLVIKILGGKYMCLGTLWGINKDEVGGR